MNSSHLKEINESELKSESLGRKIELLIRKIPPNEVNFMEITSIVGKDCLLLLTIFISIIFLVPVSIPGVSTVFGTAILLIGITRLFNRDLWLPTAIANRKLPSEQLREGFKRALIGFYKLEKISKPHRLPQLTSTGWIGHINHLSFILASLLLMVPFSFIPFSNTLPALALIFLSVAMIQRDGVSILIGNLANVLTIVYFTFLILAGGWSIQELLHFIN